jgi:hypothetical protein
MANLAHKSVRSIALGTRQIEPKDASRYTYTITVDLPRWGGTFQLDGIDGFDPTHIVCSDDLPMIAEVGFRA